MGLLRCARNDRNLLSAVAFQNLPHTFQVHGLGLVAVAPTTVVAIVRALRMASWVASTAQQFLLEKTRTPNAVVDQDI
jgi:hypothetical protein